MKFFILVSYDVSTVNVSGRNRLRKVAKKCESYGQRVQNSVFECHLTLIQLEKMERELLKIIDEEQDNLRFYRLSDSTNWNVKQYGCFKAVDFDSPLIV